jgi:hypothetical protein
MKAARLWNAALIGLASNLLAFGSLFFPFESAAFRDAPQFIYSQGTAWGLLFPDPSLIPAALWWIHLLLALSLLSIVFPLGVHLAGIRVHFPRMVYLWSSIAACVGLLWWGFVAFTTVLILNHYGSTEIYRLYPAAGLLLLGLGVSAGCDLYQRARLSKPLSNENPPPSL